jgi:Uri superfamily endonuclease
MSRISENGLVLNIIFLFSYEFFILNNVNFNVQAVVFINYLLIIPFFGYVSFYLNQQEHSILNKGIYCLLIRLFKGRRVGVGRIGVFDFPAGFYVYIGSAQNNLENRIKRHLRSEKRFHWHIDYLLQYGQLIHVYKFAGKKDKECVLSHKIGNLRNASITAKGFGSSDCSCVSHLYFFQDAPCREISELAVKKL